MGWTEEGRIEDCYKLWFERRGGGLKARGSPVNVERISYGQLITLESPVHDECHPQRNFRACM